MSAESDERELRAARNQATLRAANEKLHEMVSAFGELTGTHVIACECADAACVETLEIGESQYAEVRSNPRRFVVLPGHIYPDVEIVVEELDDYAVVEKVASAAEFAEATDPRQE